MMKFLKRILARFRKPQAPTSTWRKWTDGVLVAPLEPADLLPEPRARGSRWIERRTLKGSWFRSGTFPSRLTPETTRGSNVIMTEDRREEFRLRRKENKAMLSFTERKGIILEEARDLGFPCVTVNSYSFDNERQWIGLLHGALEGDLQDIERQLSSHAERLGAIRANEEAREREREERAKLAELPDPSWAAHECMVEDARVDAEWRKSPEGVAARTAEALEKIAGQLGEKK